MNIIDKDIKFIESCYDEYNYINKAAPFPDMSKYIDVDAEIVFDNVKYNRNETLKLIEVFCKNMTSLKVSVYDKIMCIDSDKRAYLALTNWECTTIKGQTELCPMMEIIYINGNNKIIKAIGVINMSGLGDLLKEL